MAAAARVVVATTLALASVRADDPPNNCDFAETFKDSQFSCYNSQLAASCGSMTKDCPPMWCSQQCANGLLMYYECDTGSLPDCPPSKRVEAGTFPVTGYMGENVLGSDEYHFQDYTTAAQGVYYVDRQDQFKKWAATTAVDAFRALGAANASHPGLEGLAAAGDDAILAAFETDAGVRRAVRDGLALLPEGYVANTSHLPYAGESRLGDVSKWISVAGPVVQPAISSAVSYASAHPASQWDLGCTTWNVFNFFGVGVAQRCDHYPLPGDGPTLGDGDDHPDVLDPKCANELRNCLNTSAPPGYEEVFCLWDDYNEDWPIDVYCLQECPTSGITRKLLAQVTYEEFKSQPQGDYDACTCGNTPGLVNCPTTQPTDQVEGKKVQGAPPLGQ